MSGELTPGEVTTVLSDLDMLRAHVADEVNRISAKLAGHIDWLTEQLEERDATIGRLSEELEDATGLLEGRN